MVLGITVTQSDLLTIYKWEARKLFLCDQERVH